MLSSEIMNLPLQEKKLLEALEEFRETNDPTILYKLGHRDARHVAAELAGDYENE